MSLKYKLPITNSITQTFQRWASELRGSQPLTAADFKWVDFDFTVTSGPSTTYLTIYVARYLKVGNICFLCLNFQLTPPALFANFSISLPKQVQLLETIPGEGDGGVSGTFTDVLSYGIHGLPYGTNGAIIYRADGTAFPAGGGDFNIVGFFITT